MEDFTIMKIVRHIDIAKKLNISRTTVARAFTGNNVSQETKEKVLAMAKEMGYVHNSVATNLATKSLKTVYCFIIGTIDEGYSDQMISGINDVTNAWNGYNFEIKVFITDINQQGNKCQEQMEQFHDAIVRQHPDGVIFSALNKENLKEVVTHCKEKGIPLMTLDLIYKDATMCHVGTDYFNFGVVSASYLVSQIRKKGRILTISYDDGYELSKTRMQGFFHRLQDFPNIEYMNIDVDNMGYRTYKDVLKKYVPEFQPDAIHAPYKMDYIVQALREMDMSDDYIMISNGINEDIENYLNDEIICGLVSAKPYQIGYLAANNFFNLFYRQTEVLRGVIDVGCNIYIKENYKKFDKI